MKSIFTGALIGDEHTLRDWGAIITNSDVIGMPEPNTVLLEVPGRSGRLDLSEVLTKCPAGAEGLICRKC